MGKHKHVFKEAVSEMKHFLVGAGLVLTLVAVVPALAQTSPPGGDMPRPPSEGAGGGAVMPQSPPSGGAVVPSPSDFGGGAPAGAPGGAPTIRPDGQPVGGPQGQPVQPGQPGQGQPSQSQISPGQFDPRRGDQQGSDMRQGRQDTRMQQGTDRKQQGQFPGQGRGVEGGFPGRGEGVEGGFPGQNSKGAGSRGVEGRGAEGRGFEGDFSDRGAGEDTQSRSGRNSFRQMPKQEEMDKFRDSEMGRVGEEMRNKIGKDQMGKFRDEEMRKVGEEMRTKFGGKEGFRLEDMQKGRPEGRQEGMGRQEGTDRGFEKVQDRNGKQPEFGKMREDSEDAGKFRDFGKSDRQMPSTESQRFNVTEQKQFLDKDLMKMFGREKSFKPAFQMPEFEEDGDLEERVTALDEFVSKFLEKGKRLSIKTLRKNAVVVYSELSRLAQDEERDDVVEELVELKLAIRKAKKADLLETVTTVWNSVRERFLGGEEGAAEEEEELFE